MAERPANAQQEPHEPWFLIRLTFEHLPPRISRMSNERELAPGRAGAGLGDGDDGLTAGDVCDGGGDGLGGGGERARDTQITLSRLHVRPSELIPSWQ